MKGADQACEEVEEGVRSQHGQCDFEQRLDGLCAVDFGCVIKFLGHILEPGEEYEHTDTALDGHEDEDPFDHHGICEPGLPPGEAEGFDEAVYQAEIRAPDEEEDGGGAGYGDGAGHDGERAEELDAAHFYVEEQRLQQADDQPAGHGDSHVEQGIHQGFAGIVVVCEVNVVTETDPLSGLEDIVDGEAVVEGVEDGVGLEGEDAHEPGEKEEEGEQAAAETAAAGQPVEESGRFGGIQAWLRAAQEW